MPTHAKKPAALKHCAHGGPMKCNMGCYADGGEISRGFNGALGSAGIQSSIKNLVTKPKMMAEGGMVSWKGDSKLMGRKPSEVEEPKEDIDPGFGMDHELLGRKGGMYEEHHMKEGSDVGEDRELLADGGEVGEGEEEMEHMLAEELLHAMEKKDKKGVAEAIEALVMQCMNKGGM